MRSVYTFLYALIVLTTGLSDAKADLILQLGTAGDVGRSSYLTVAGNDLTVDVFLQQTAGENRLTTANTALAIADFEVTVANALEGIPQVVPKSFQFGPGFVDDGNAKITGQTLRLSEFESSGSGDIGVTTANDGIAINNAVLLGRVTFSISTLAEGVYTLNVRQTPVFSPFALADPGFPIPITVAATSGAINVSAVPEPSSLILMTALTFGMLFRRRRNRS